ncbi:single-stranded DNA-binding protein (plasmid) [Rubrobacter tropicus]|uniref:Single-stranded DNA-binding protein n=1 Tax=Rubrobacter tropicus TaxID=2653851 RepID=A0A6G8QFQ6_9ACTN|nr:single-stranded DNA-binding protein [Rubrobacter tropicus]QIN85346.1 single-stranded DNA-binding protein [Rubrobacter tropicus]
MVSYNRVVLAGNITRDPELRFTQAGIPVCNFGLAQNKVRGDKEHTNFFDVSAWRELGETVANYKKKGDPILLEGRLEYRTWEDPETGKTRSKHEVVADNIQFLGGGKNGSGGGSGGGSGEQGTKRGSGGRQEADSAPEDLEDIPFRAVNAKRLNVEGIL